MTTITLDKAQLQARAKVAQVAYTKPKLKKKKSVLETLDATKIVILPPPQFNDVQLYNMRSTAILYSQAYNSDPHAYKRILLHMRMGFEDASSVRAHAEAVLAARASHHVPERV